MSFNLRVISFSVKRLLDTIAFAWYILSIHPPQKVIPSKGWPHHISLALFFEVIYRNVWIEDGAFTRNTSCPVYIAI